MTMLLLLFLSVRRVLALPLHFGYSARESYLCLRPHVTTWSLSRKAAGDRKSSYSTLLNANREETRPADPGLCQGMEVDAPSSLQLRQYLTLKNKKGYLVRQAVYLVFELCQQLAAKYYEFLYALCNKLQWNQTDHLCDLVLFLMKH
jgi:hypothetical protein